MRRLITVALLTATLMTSSAFASAATSDATAAKLCTQKAVSPAGVKSLIQCIAPKLGVPTSRPMYYGWRESRYHPGICNSSDHCGVFQICGSCGLWSHMIHSYVYGKGKALGVISRTNGRANVILSVRLMRHEGYWPWGG